MGDRPSSSLGSGYVDLQVNGFGGIDFNSDGLTPKAMQEACQRMRDDGAAGFLPTIITAELGAMCSRLARITEARQNDPLAQEMILGVHIEGPFICPEPGYVGAHPVDAVRRPNLSDMERLLESADGLTRIVTLAPELDDGHVVTRFLSDQGITVAAGHSKPTLDELRAAIDAGLSMFTHLGNGCPHQLQRHENIIEHVLSLSDRLWISFIADGMHVPFPALGNYLRAANLERCVVVSDAISAAGMGPGRYPLGNQMVEVGEDNVPRSPGREGFAGASTSVTQMASLLRHDLNFTEEQIEQLTSIGPRSILGQTPKV